MGQGRPRKRGQFGGQSKARKGRPRGAPNNGRRGDPKPLPKRKKKRTEAEKLQTQGARLTLAPSDVADARNAADAALEAARENLTSTFTEDGFEGLLFRGMGESDKAILASTKALKAYLKSRVWDTWPAQTEGTTMSTRLHFGRSQDVRREALLPKYNWSGMVSATEAFCRPAPPVIEVLMRAVGVAVAKLFPEEFQQLQRDGNVKPEDCRLSVTVTVWGCATEIWWWRLVRKLVAL